MLADTIKRIEWFRSLIDFAFPPLCPGCGAFYEIDTTLCPRCVKRAARCDFALCLHCGFPIEQGGVCRRCEGDSFALLAYGDYIGPVKEAVHGFKFQHVTGVASFFAREIREQFELAVEELSPEVIVPVPLHGSREYMRGYNQAQVFAGAVGQVLNLPVDSELLVRSGKRKPQSKVDKRHRGKNIRGVFEVLRQIEGDFRVLLVDDVVTTGATVLEARRTLEQAGCTPIAVAAIAYAGHHHA